MLNASCMMLILIIASSVSTPDCVGRHIGPWSVAGRTVVGGCMLLQLYLEALEQRPLVTKMVTCAILNAGEELVAQVLSKMQADPSPAERRRRGGGERATNAVSVVQRWVRSVRSVLSGRVKSALGVPVEWGRVGKMCLYGLAVNGPVSHGLYGVVGRVFGALTGVGWVDALLHLGAVNVGVIPVVTYLYLYAMGVIDGLKGDALHARILDHFVPICKQTWTYFPIIQLVVFKLAPPRTHVPIFNLIGFLYGVYLNFQAQQRSS